MAKSPKDTHGPVVKTGPTRGQNRSRNDDGAWRAKRSDAGKPREKPASSGGSSDSGKKSRCFLTTAACKLRGLPDDCHELTVMRAFRDDVLSGTPEGRALVEDYYDVAPSLVPLVRQPGLTRLVWDGIQQTVQMIEAGKSNEAIACYQDMTKFLKAQIGR